MRLETIIVDGSPDFTGMNPPYEVLVKCPVCKMDWHSKGWAAVEPKAQTLMGYYYDPVDCDCGNVLTPSIPVVTAENPAMLPYIAGARERTFANGEHSIWPLETVRLYFPDTVVPVNPDDPLGKTTAQASAMESLTIALEKRRAALPDLRSNLAN